MQAAKMETAIKRVLELSSDEHNVYTPSSVCDQMIDKLPPVTGKTLVVTNIEFVYTLLQRGVAKEDIYFATPCDIKRHIVSQMIPKENTFTYQQCITTTDVQNMKFDSVIMNPPYNKLNKEPAYYEFFRQVVGVCKPGATFATVTPTGFLIGPNAHDIRSFVLDNYNIQYARRVSGEVFIQETENKKKTAQPIVVLIGTIGCPTQQFSFEHDFRDEQFVTTVNADNDVYTNGVPLYVGECTKDMIACAEQFADKFAMKNRSDEYGVCINFANNSGHYSPSKTLGGYLRGVRAAATVTTTGTVKNRHHHPCKSEEDAVKLCSWMNSNAARLIQTMWSTTHRTTGTNLGRVPAIITTGPYTDAEAYSILGLSQQTQDWLNSIND